MTNPPLVTIIIPTCRREPDIVARAVKSALAQTHQNLEIIVVDDSPASFAERDAVRRCMSAFADQRLRYIQNPRNIGGGPARNVGIELAQGDYIAFLDDDDKYLPEKTERQVAFMREGGYDLTLTGMVMHNARGRVVDVRTHSAVQELSQEDLLRYHLKRHLTGTPTFMFTREALARVGGFESVPMGQEFYLMLRCIEQGLKVGYLPECLVDVYIHQTGGISHGGNKISGENALYRRKQAYFARLTGADRRYIRFRHYAVLAVAYLRCRRPLSAALMGAIAVFCSPKDALHEFTGHFSRIKSAPGG